MRSPTLLPHAALGVLLAVAACLLSAPPSFAGGYAVTACFGIENAAWSEWEPSPFVTAYTACPGGVVDVPHPQSGEGTMVRNVVVVGGGPAPQGAAAALAFDAPAGTSIAGIDFDAKLLSNPGWQAGIRDATHGGWLWCGEGCGSTVGLWVHKELRGLSTQRVEALVRCAAARCRRDARHGYVAVRNARVFLDDPSAPQLGGVRGSLVAGGDGWFRGVHDVAFDAGDNSGIRLGRIELDGRAVHDDARPCDFTRPVPCSDGAIGASFDTRTWADGAHALRLAAQDAGGSWASIDRSVRVDNTPPAEPAPVLEGGPDWSPLRVRRLLLPLPDGQAAPLVRARLKACRVGGACEESAPELEAVAGGGAARVAAFDGPGEYSVRVALEDAAGNVGPYAAPVTLRFDDVRPGLPDVAAADAWQRGGVLPLDTLGERPISGIRGYRVRIGGREATVATALPLDELPEGSTPIQVSAVSGAGVESSAVRTTLKLDRSRPVAKAGGAPDGWSRMPVLLMLRGRDQQGLSGVRSLSWTVDGGDEATAEGDGATLELPDDGRHTVSYRAVDGAGNVSEPHAVAVRLDRTPPETVAFEAPDPADPRRIRVVAADRTSGVARGRIELRGAGTGWRRVRTALQGDHLVALLDDAALRAGRYELRAHVTDVAGNEAVGARRVDGAPATLTLPLRRRMRLAVHRVGTTLRARLTVAGDRRTSAPPRPTVVGDRRTSAPPRPTVVGDRRTSTAPRPTVVGDRRTSAPARPTVVGDRRTSAPPRPTVVGDRRTSTAPRPRLTAVGVRRVGTAPRLRVTVAGGSPLAGREVTLSQRLRGRTTWRRVCARREQLGAVAECTRRTDRDGRVDVPFQPGPSRTLRLTFAGDRLLLPATATTRIRTPARARLHVHPSVASPGAAVRFTGRLLGGHIPRVGKLVELQALVGAGWRTFATLRSDRRGNVRYAHHFAAFSGGRSYRFRLRIRRERSYPFDRATSHAVAVRVR